MSVYSLKCLLKGPCYVCGKQHINRNYSLLKTVRCPLFLCDQLFLLEKQQFFFFFRNYFFLPHTSSASYYSELCFQYWWCFFTFWVHHDLGEFKNALFHEVKICIYAVVLLDVVFTFQAVWQTIVKHYFCWQIILAFSSSEFPQHIQLNFCLILVVKL